jgi:thiol-disulfide isomerase/thioredoxin
MTTRRSFVFSAAALIAAALPAHAFEFRPYAHAAAAKAIASGKGVVLHVYAPWCLQCHMQAAILDGLAADRRYDGIAFFKVDYDNQKDVVAALGVPRSTLIAYKGGREVARMSWGMTQDAVVNVLKAAM